MACTADLRVLSPEEANGLDSYAPAYGRLERTRCLRTRVASPLPKAVATFITGITDHALPSLKEVPVTQPPGTTWHASAFQLSWRGQEAIILTAMERSPDTAGGGAPGTMWGCELAQTDARTAFIQLGGQSGDDASTPVMIRGTRAEPGARWREACRAQVAGDASPQTGM